MVYEQEVLLRLVISALAGGFIGMEREAKNRPAGLKTHILVTLGSALIMLISMYGFDGMGTNNEGGEPARLAAQVVSGIGFLGAGTILRNGNNIQGLTTAASIWVCGGIGLAIGNGYYFGGIATSIIVMITLKTMGFLEKRIFKSNYKSLIVHCKRRVGLIGDVGQILGKNNISVRDIKINDDDGDDELVNGSGLTVEEIKFTLKLPPKLIVERLFDDILSINGVVSAGWECDMIDS